MRVVEGRGGVAGVEGGRRVVEVERGIIGGVEGVEGVEGGLVLGLGRARGEKRRVGVC